MLAIRQGEERSVHGKYVFTDVVVLYSSQLAGGKIHASGCLPSVPHRWENMWGTSTGVPVNM